MNYDVAILGAGASGLFLAANLKNQKILLIEHNSRIGAKIAISGGGKANVTNQNVSSANYFSSNPAFVQQVLQRFSTSDLLKWLKRRGCNPILAKPYQFFCPKSANQLIATFQKELKAQVKLAEEIKRVEPGFCIVTNRAEYRAKRVVVATGGLSFKKLGASGIGYEIAHSFDHDITPLRPALVGLTPQPQQFWFKELSGISMRVRVKVGNKEFYDNILFTHRGISGPAILNASLYWERGAIEIAFTDRVEHYLKNPHRIISTQLPLPKRFVKIFLRHLGVSDKPVRKLNEKERRQLRAFELYRFAPAGTFGFERAEVTKGGVELDEIDPKTMESRLQKGLYFIGEVLDVTGELGGYNFQWAFSSAWVAKEALTH